MTTLQRARSEFRHITLSGARGAVNRGGRRAVFLVSRLLAPGILASVLLMSQCSEGGAGVAGGFLRGFFAARGPVPGCGECGGDRVWGTMSLWRSEIIRSGRFKGYPWTWGRYGGGRRGGICRSGGCWERCGVMGAIVTSGRAAARGDQLIRSWHARVAGGLDCGNGAGLGA